MYLNTISHQDLIDQNHTAPKVETIDIKNELEKNVSHIPKHQDSNKSFEEVCQKQRRRKHVEYLFYIQYCRITCESRWVVDREDSDLEEESLSDCQSKGKVKAIRSLDCLSTIKITSCMIIMIMSSIIVFL